MKKLSCRLWILALLGVLAILTLVHADGEEGEKLLTPNQQKRIAQINHDLPEDLVDKSRDSHQVSELRRQLRQALSTYQETVKQFGNGTPQSRKAGHKIIDIQVALHKQYVHEEALPAIGLAELPRDHEK